MLNCFQVLPTGLPPDENTSITIIQILVALAPANSGITSAPWKVPSGIHTCVNQVLQSQAPMPPIWAEAQLISPHFTDTFAKRASVTSAWSFLSSEADHGVKHSRQRNRFHSGLLTKHMTRSSCRNFLPFLQDIKI